MKSIVGFGITITALLVLIVGIAGCQDDFSSEDAAKLVDALLSDPRYQRVPGTRLHYEKFVDALLSDPRYQEYLERSFDDEEIAKFVDAMLSHPLYQTTPEEDCATIILMGAAMSGNYTLPSESERNELCAWYAGQ